MIIGIDANEANIKDKVGVHQYSFEILWSLYKQNSQKFYRTKNKNEKHKYILYLKNSPRSDLPKETSWWKYKVLSGRAFWILSRLTPHLIFQKPVDVFFSPSHYLPIGTNIPTVCTIHDLGYLKFSGQFKKRDFWQLKYWTAKSILASKHIIAVSKSAKKNIVRQYKVPSEKVTVAYHGYDKSRFKKKVSKSNVRRVLKKYDIPKNYILSIGTLKPSKNIEGLIEAFSKYLKKSGDQNTKLVIAGKKGWLFDSIFETVKELDLERKILFTDFVTEGDKPALLSGAKILISPSFWEGFGMQVLEAFACGTPAIVSDVASLPEVAGEAGVYVDPSDINSIYLAINKVMKMNKKEYDKLVNKSLKQAEEFSWDKSGKITLSVLEDASNNV